MKKCFARVCTLLLTVLLLCSMLPTFAFGDEDEHNADSEGTVDYVLILNNTYKAQLSDKENNRKAAAKLFVDLLPIDNARVCVLMIGADDETMKSSYHLRADEDHMAKSDYRLRCIYTLYDLQEANDKQSRERVKDIIDTAYEQKGSVYSDLHCALYAAADTLKYYNSDNACVVLISDGHAAYDISHQVYSSDGRAVEIKDGHDMLDDIKKEFYQSGREWTINWLNISEEISAADKNYADRLEGIVKSTGGESEQQLSLLELPTRIAAIVSKYSGASKGDEDRKTYTIGSNGKLTAPLGDFLMLTEANVVVTGEGIRKLAVQDPFGSVIERDTDRVWAIEERDAGDGTFFYAGKKLIRPQGGTWNVVVEGEAGASVLVQTIRTLEPDLYLTGAESNTKLDIGDKVSFIGKFYYDDKELECGEAAYNAFLPSARLVCKNKLDGSTVDMELRVSGQQFVSEFVATKEGTYNFTLIVSSNQFKSGSRESNSISDLSVNNNIPVVDAQIPDIENISVGAVAERINLADYFSDKDKEELSYTVSCRDRTADISWMLEQGYLTVTAPVISGDYELEVYATDENSASSRPIVFTVHVVNEAPVMQQAPSFELVCGNVDWLVRLGLLDEKEVGVKTVVLSEIASDPEGLPIRYYYRDADSKNEDGEDILVVHADSFDENVGTFSFTAAAPGSCRITVGVLDSCRESDEQTVDITVIKPLKALWERYWIWPMVLAIIIVILAILMASRRVRGRWTVEANDQPGGFATPMYHRFATVLSAVRNAQLKKTKVPLKAIVRQACVVDHSDVNLNAMDTSSIVFLGNLGGANKFSYKANANVKVYIGERAISKSGAYTLKRRQPMKVEYHQGGVCALEIKVSYE